jgi:hypothetical protein
METGTLTLGQLLKKKLDDSISHRDELPLPERRFTFPKEPLPCSETTSRYDIHACNIDKIIAIRLFREATGASLAEAKWSHDASFKMDLYISALDLMEWIKAYHEEMRRMPHE